MAKIPQTISFGVLSRQTFGDAPFPLAATASSGLTVSFSVLSGPAVVNGNIVTITGAGMVVLRASQPGDETYASAPIVDQVLLIAPGNNVVADAQSLANGMFAFRFYSEPGAYYRVQASTNLVNRLPLATNQISGLGYLNSPTLLQRTTTGDSIGLRRSIRSRPMRQAGRPLWVQERPVCRPWTSPDRPFEFKTGEDAARRGCGRNPRDREDTQHCSAEARRGSAEQPQPKTFLTAISRIGTDTISIFQLRDDQDFGQPLGSMQTIPSSLIDKTWEHLNETPPEEVKVLFERMTAEQPILVGYLLAIEEDVLEKKQQGTLLFLGMVIWQIMSNGGAMLTEVTPEALEAAEDANIAFLERLDEDSEMNYMSAVTQMMDRYNQTPLLGAILDALMEGNEDTPELADDSMGLALVHLKTVIDCLDQ